MAVTVTATQGGSTANGMVLRVFVLTGAKAVAQQAGGSAQALISGGTMQLSVTTTQAGSRVYGAASYGNTTAPTALANTTGVDAVADSGNTATYATFKAAATTGTPGATTYGYSAPAASTGPMAELEILTSGTLAEDASGPAAASTTSATTVTTASFTPPGGALLVALVGSDGGAAVTTMSVTDTGGGFTWVEQVKNNTSGGDYAGVWIADVPAAGAVTFVPQRYGQPAPVSPAPWAQRDRRDASTVATAANPLPSPLDTAWQADAAYWHLYGDDALRDRRACFTQPPRVSDPLMLTGPAAFDPTTAAAADTARRYGLPATHADRREVPAQKDRRDANTVATTANPLVSPLDSAWQAGGGYWHLYNRAADATDRRQAGQQRPYISDPSAYPSAPVTTGVGSGTTEAWWGTDPAPFQIAQRRYISDPAFTPAQPDPVLAAWLPLWLAYNTPATNADRREVPQQRACISDPSSYPSGAVTDPLTVAWGAGGPYWHLYNRAGDITDRRAYFTQRLYLSDPLLLLSAQLENELLGGAETGKHGWWQRPGSWPQQRPYISDPSSYPSGAPTDPLTLAWGAGGPYWHLYNRAADATDRREVPQQRPYVSDPLLLTTAQLENELLGGAGTAQRYGSAAYYDRREVPQQRGLVVLVSPPVPFDPLLAAWADLARRYGLAATHADRRLYPQQRLYFPVPLPPPPFTIGLLTASDAALAVLTALDAAGGSGGVLTATDRRTGGPG